MLTVLHVLEAVNAGCARHVTDLVVHVEGVRHVVAVPARRAGDVTDTEAVPRMRAAGAEVHLVDMRRLPPHPRNAAAWVTLARLARAVRPDVVHGHASVGGALARVLPVPARVVWTPNGVLTHPLVVATERVLARRTDVIVAVSPGEAQLLARLRIQPRGEIRTIRNGIDLTRAADGTDLRAMLGVPPGTPLVGSLGRLVPQKAPLDVVEVFRRVATQRPDVHFVLIGDGRLAAAVDAAVASWDVHGQVHRIPELPRAARVLGQLQAFVLMSHYEGAPYAPLEAMREGAPVVLTDVVGSADTVAAGDSGFLVERGDSEAAARIVLDIVDKEAMSSAVAKRAEARLVAHHDVRAMADAHRRLYEGLVDRP